MTVIALEMQAHGHTADVDRPLRIRTLADDTVGALRELGVEEAAAPTLIAIGDSDVVPEHAVQMFRLLGGGVSGDTPAGLPKSRLAVLPGTSHTMMVDRAEMLMPMLSTFLDDAS